MPYGVGLGGQFLIGYVFRHRDTVGAVVVTPQLLRSPAGDGVQLLTVFHKGAEHLHRLRSGGELIAHAGELSQSAAPQLRRPLGGGGGAIVVHKARCVVQGKGGFLVALQLLQCFLDGHCGSSFSLWIHRRAYGPPPSRTAAPEWAAGGGSPRWGRTPPAPAPPDTPGAGSVRPAPAPAEPRPARCC